MLYFKNTHKQESSVLITKEWKFSVKYKGTEIFLEQWKIIHVNTGAREIVEGSRHLLATVDPSLISGIMYVYWTFQRETSEHEPGVSPEPHWMSTQNNKNTNKKDVFNFFYQI